MARAKAKFTPFSTDETAAIPNGSVYKCRGCGGVITDGQLIYETIKDHQVIGLYAVPGTGGPDVEPTHLCGEVPDQARHVT